MTASHAPLDMQRKKRRQKLGLVLAMITVAIAIAFPRFYGVAFLIPLVLAVLSWSVARLLSAAVIVVSVVGLVGAFFAGPGSVTTEQRDYTHQPVRF